MTQQNIDLLPEGFHDRLFEEAALISRNARSMTDILTAHGYRRVMPAIAEYESSLISRLQGVDRNHLMRFTDPVSGRTMAMRSDMTLQVGRIAATRLTDMPRPLRLCYHGVVAKLRVNPLNPNREMTQLGAELIGNDTISAVCEMVALAIEALKSVGVKGITIDFTLPDLVKTLAQKTFPLADDVLQKVSEQLDMKDASALKSLGADDYLPLLYATGEFAEAIEKLSAIDAGGALSSRIEGLKSITQHIADDVHVTLDPTERHGFEYQSWIGFTLYADNIAGAIGRGGTYQLDNGEDATGFSLYPDALNNVSNVIEERYLFLPLNHDVSLASGLRKEGWITVAALKDSDDGKALGCSHYLDDQTIIAYAS